MIYVFAVLSCPARHSGIRLLILFSFSPLFPNLSDRFGNPLPVVLKGRRAMVASASFFCSAAFVYRDTSASVAWPVMAAISLAENPASASGAPPPSAIRGLRNASAGQPRRCDRPSRKAVSDSVTDDDDMFEWQHDSNTATTSRVSCDGRSLRGNCAHKQLDNETHPNRRLNL